MEDLLEFMRRNKLEKNEVQVGEIYRVLALVYTNLGNLEEGNKYAEMGVEHLKEIVGENHVILTLSLNDLAVTYWKARDFLKSLELY